MKFYVQKSEHVDIKFLKGSTPLKIKQVSLIEHRVLQVVV